MRLIAPFIYRRIAHRPQLVKIVENIGWLFADKLLRMAVGLVVGVAIARYLGPEQFGLLNFATAFVGIFGVVAGLGLQHIVVREIVANPLSKEKSLGAATWLLACGGIMFYGFMIAGIFWLRPDDTLAKVLVAIIGSSLLFKVSDVSLFWFESQVQSKYVVFVQNCVFIIFSSIKIGLILKNQTLIYFAWVGAIEGLVASIGLILIFIHQVESLKFFKFSFTYAKRLLSESWPLMLSGMAIMVYMRIDQVMLGQIGGNEAVGVFSAAARISEMWYFFPMAITASVFPSIIRSKKVSEKQYDLRLQKLYDAMVWIALAIAIPTTLFSSKIIFLLYGEAYADSSNILAVHVWAGVFVFLGVASSKWFIVEKLQMLSLLRTLLGAAINVILNLILIPDYGAIGAAWATVAAQICASFLFDAMHGRTKKMFIMKLSALNIIGSAMRFKNTNKIASIHN